MLRLVTSKTRYRATAKSSEVIENMERERGLEPPASSLGIWMAIENKDNGAQDDEYSPKQISNFRNAF